MGKLKRLFTVLMIFLGGYFISCTSQKSFKSDSVTIELKGNPSTGFTWEYKLSSEDIVEVSKEVKYLGAEGMVGAPSIFYFNIKSIKSGNTLLSFEYKRPWESNPPAEKKVFYINVEENGNILISEDNFSKTKLENNNDSFISISMEAGLERMAKSQDFILLDVRSSQEYNSGHIPNALLLPNELISLQKAEELLPNKNQEIYIYCRSGRRSKEAAKKLFELGYKKIIEIGGILSYNGDLEY